MKKLKLTLLFVGTILVLLITFFTGSFLGATQSYMRESVFRSLSIVNDLKGLRKGKIEDQIKYKETSLDIEILLAMEYEKLGYSWVLFPFPSDNTKFLKSIASYRKQHPSTLKSKPSETEYQFILANEELIKQYGQGNEVVK
jgi:hypothetical protein